MNLIVCEVKFTACYYILLIMHTNKRRTNLCHLKVEAVREGFSVEGSGLNEEASAEVAEDFGR